MNFNYCTDRSEKEDATAAISAGKYFDFHIPVILPFDLNKK